MWLFMAVLSAFFAGVTSILAKCAIQKTDSDLAMALRAVVVLGCAWGMALAVGSVGTVTEIDWSALTFLLLSGFATGASWLCYFKALSLGDVNRVVPVDKSSTVLSVLLAVVLFGETAHLAVKLLGTAALGAGIFLMLDPKPTEDRGESNRWMLYSVLSALFAALTSILAKIGMAEVESNLATAIRTGVVLVMAWGIVVARGKQKELRAIDKKELGFIVLSGLATGASWLCYYYALQNGVVSVVIPIDKMSILITVLFSYFVFREKLSRKAAVGLGLMLGGTVAMAMWA